MWAWMKRHDLFIFAYGAWLTALTIAEFGWPWHW